MRNTYNIGDIVRVKSGYSTSSQKLAGKIGKIIKIAKSGESMYCCLDIEKSLTNGGGIWLREIELVTKAPPDLSHIKPYGIARFMEEHHV